MEHGRSNYPGVMGRNHAAQDHISGLSPEAALRLTELAQDVTRRYAHKENDSVTLNAAMRALKRAARQGRGWAVEVLDRRAKVLNKPRPVAA